MFKSLQININLKFCGIFLLLIGLGACETTGFGSSSALITGEGLEGFLTGSDKARARIAIETALQSRGKTPVIWRNGSTGNSGRVSPGSALVGGLSDDGTMYRAPTGLDISAPLETGLGSFRLTRNANVRLGRSTDAKRLTTLAKGTRVRALGRDNGSNWLLVARGNKIAGYIYGPLLAEAGTDDLVLAGGPTVRPTYCRSFVHHVQLNDGRKDKNTKTACRSKRGKWGVVRRGR